MMNCSLLMPSGESNDGIDDKIYHRHMSELDHGDLILHQNAYSSLRDDGSLLLSRPNSSTFEKNVDRPPTTIIVRIKKNKTPWRSRKKKSQRGDAAADRKGRKSFLSFMHMKPTKRDDDGELSCSSCSSLSMGSRRRRAVPTARPSSKARANPTYNADAKSPARTARTEPMSPRYCREEPEPRPKSMLFCSTNVDQSMEVVLKEVPQKKQTNSDDIVQTEDYQSQWLTNPASIQKACWDWIAK